MAGPLDSLTIAVSGTFPGHKHASLQKAVEDAGAEFVSKVNSSVTHLVCSATDYEKVSSKVKQAQGHGIIIVSLDWLLESISSQRKLDETSFLLGASSQPAAVSNNSKKRDRDDAKASGDSDPAAQAKMTLDGDLDGETQSKITSRKKQKTSPVSTNENGKKTVKVEDEPTQTMVLKLGEEEHCPLKEDSHPIYVDDANVIYDASLNQTNAGANNNKFYRIALIQNGHNDYRVWTRWGRVGELGQSKVLGDGSLSIALQAYEKKFREKSGLSWANRLDPPRVGKYAYIERSYEPDPSEDEGDVKQETSASPTKKAKPLPESTLAPAVQRLMDLIFNENYFSAAMADMNYDRNKLPLGKLSKRTLQQGYQILKDLAQLIGGSNVTSAHRIPELSNLYYSLIPHDFGRRVPPVIRNSESLKKEVDLLQSLSDMSIAEEIMNLSEKAGDDLHPLDRRYAGLNLSEMVALECSSTEYKELAAYLVGSHGATHGFRYKILDIFRIVRCGENDRFEQSIFSKLDGDRRLLWHGSRSTNFGGILSQGLRIAPPEAPVSGYMFGKGVYLADMSSKSANYCCSWSSGGIGLLLLCEAELGKPILELTNADYTAGQRAKDVGCHSTWGKGTLGPKGWKDANCVNENLKGVLMPDLKEEPGPTGVAGACLCYNEFICYDVAQIRLRYLFKVEMK